MKLLRLPNSNSSKDVEVEVENKMLPQENNLAEEAVAAVVDVEEITSTVEAVVAITGEEEVAAEAAESKRMIFRAACVYDNHFGIGVILVGALTNVFNNEKRKNCMCRTRQSADI